MPRYRIYEQGFDSLVEMNITPDKLLELIEDFLDHHCIINHELWFKYLREKQVKFTLLFATKELDLQ
ncbi:MAG: hypothetical protein ACTSR8_08530 [Promethearchaeota archaeon]